MPFLELTTEQETIVMRDIDPDAKGSILGHIYETDDGRVLCHCGFVPEPLAKRLFKIMERFWAGEDL